jgi:hypothetical protein
MTQEWVFIACYTVFGALVAISWFRVRLRRIIGHRAGKSDVRCTVDSADASPDTLKTDKELEWKQRTYEQSFS